MMDVSDEKWQEDKYNFALKLAAFRLEPFFDNIIAEGGLWGRESKFLLLPSPPPPLQPPPLQLWCDVLVTSAAC